MVPESKGIYGIIFYTGRKGIANVQPLVEEKPTMFEKLEVGMEVGRVVSLMSPYRTTKKCTNIQIH